MEDINEELLARAPTQEQVDEAYAHNDELLKRLIAEDLEGTVTAEHLAHKLTLAPEEVRRRVKEGEIIAFSLGRGLDFIPTWQFGTNEEGSLLPEPNPLLMQFWKAWGGKEAGQTRAFCRAVRTFRYASGESILDLVRDGGDQTLIEDVETRMSEHFIGSM